MACQKMLAGFFIRLISDIKFSRSTFGHILFHKLLESCSKNRLVSVLWKYCTWLPSYWMDSSFCWMQYARTGVVHIICLISTKTSSDADRISISRVFKWNFSVVIQFYCKQGTFERLTPEILVTFCFKPVHRRLSIAPEPGRQKVKGHWCHLERAGSSHQNHSWFQALGLHWVPEQAQTDFTPAEKAMTWALPVTLKMLNGSVSVNSD